MGALVGSSPADPPTKQQIEAYSAAKTRYAKAVAGDLADTQANYSAYPDGDSHQCYYAKDHDSADLCAQWRAAVAAEWSARWTFWTFVTSGFSTLLSIVGLFALITTLRQTERSLKQSRKSNRIAQDVAQKQLRAYIGIASVKMDAKNGNVWFYVKNYGQTRAIKVTVFSRRIETEEWKRSPIATVEPGQELPVLNKSIVSAESVIPTTEETAIFVKIEFCTIYLRKYWRTDQFYYPITHEETTTVASERIRDWIILYTNGRIEEGEN
ncbi:hypothetical protein [Sphingomonas sp. UYEF23]|uniref:hypothetical protein n=1 Tax=Sphingomonas sp. UYEF23 TaxID=1756408 RepID=UPI003396C62E